MENKADSATGCLLVIALWAVTGIAFFLQGLYLMLAWGWVVVPIFKLPALSYWGATGLSVMWSIIFQGNSNSNNDVATTLKGSITVLVVDTVFMAILWLISLGI